MTRIHTRAALLALTTVALVAGCTTTPTPTTSISSTSPYTTPTSLSPSRSLTPTTSPADHELVSAQQAVVTLWATVDKLVNNRAMIRTCGCFSAS